MKASRAVILISLLLLAGILLLARPGETVPAFSPAIPAQSAAPSPSAAPAAPDKEENESSGLSRQPSFRRGLWVPWFLLSCEDEESFRQRFGELAGRAKAAGIDALLVHVRPFCDALYPSEDFPWSHVVGGEQGKNPGWDPLELMIAQCRAQGLEFHAWVNPLRVKSAQTPAALSPENPYSLAGEDSPEAFLQWEGSVWLNPAVPWVRSLIARGAAEIAANYDVDGIVFDDYFYPTSDPAPDESSYADYLASCGEGMPLSLEDWRRANVSALLQEVLQAVHGANPRAVFGVSPAGNMENDLEIGADVGLWCAAEGFADWISPQLYYSFENPALPFGEALASWDELPAREGLPLYASLALYKLGDEEADGGTWAGEPDMIARQEEAAAAAGWQGVIFYSAEYLDYLDTENSPALP